MTITNQVRLLFALSTLTAVTGCAKISEKIGDYTVKPVVNAAIRNGNRESEELQKQAKTNEIKGLSSGIQPLPATNNWPGVNSN
jgi:hypothetical protein